MVVVVMTILILIKVIKADNEVCWTHKAFNGRVLLEWLSWCLENAWMRFPEKRNKRFGLTYQAQTLCSNWWTL